MAKNGLPLSEYHIIWDGQEWISVTPEVGRQISKHTLSETEVLLEFLRNTKMLHSLRKKRGNQQKYLKGGYSWWWSKTGSGWWGYPWKIVLCEAWNGKRPQLVSLRTSKLTKMPSLFIHHCFSNWGLWVSDDSKILLAIYDHRIFITTWLSHLTLLIILIVRNQAEIIAKPWDKTIEP